MLEQAATGQTCDSYHRRTRSHRRNMQIKFIATREPALSFHGDRRAAFIVAAAVADVFDIAIQCVCVCVLTIRYKSTPSMHTKCAINARTPLSV